jgi:NAD(P)-dependent dehydrogenase (short-subunit alcohol dehydrogenase family)
MSIDINNKIALVTGANRGIGKAIVESFVQHGAKKVYLAVRNLESTTDLVSKFGGIVVPVYVDMNAPESISALAETATDVDIVVNNAGILKLADPLSDDVEELFNQELTVNTFGLIRMAKAFIPVLEKNGGGAFVQLNSVASIKNFAGFTTYSASKAAAYSLTQGLRDQVADKGIQVLSVHPGPIATDMANEAGMGEMGQPVDSVSEGIVASLKAGDFHLFPDEMAKQFEAGYSSYADNFIEAQPTED